jgi:hypothetical protein
MKLIAGLMLLWSFSVGAQFYSIPSTRRTVPEDAAQVLGRTTPRKHTYDIRNLQAVSVKGTVVRWVNTNTVVVTYSENITVRETVAVEEQTVWQNNRGWAPGSWRTVGVNRITEPRTKDVERLVTVTGLPAGFVKAGEVLKVNCFKLPVTAPGMHASFLFEAR